MSEKLEGLLERVEAASGPDREIDCLLACTLDGFFPTLKDGAVGVGNNKMTWRVDFCRRDDDGGLVSPGHGGDQMVRPYTASLDVALALMERLLPGWRPSIAKERLGGWSVFMIEDCPATTPLGEIRTVKSPHLPTAPLALLAATLRALIATSKESGR